MEWAIFGTLFIFVIIMLAILGDNLSQKRKMAMRELLQKERLAAMEQGLPLPEWDAALLGDDTAPASAEVHARRIEWLRFMSLCIGLVLMFAGAGMGLAFSFSDLGEFQELASISAIPFMTGLGLLLFNLLTRKRTP